MPDTVLVTGAPGYLGQAVLKELLSDGKKVIALVRSHKDHGLPEGISVVAVDLAHAGAVTQALRDIRPDAVIHAAAEITNGTDKQSTELVLSNNIRATLNLAHVALSWPTKRFVLCSTAEVYADMPSNGRSHRECDLPDPQNVYGSSKLIGEGVVRLLEANGTQVVSVRMPGIHGGGRQTGVVARMIERVLRGEPLSVPEPQSRLSFLWRQDAARVLVTLSSRDCDIPGPIVNIANGSLDLFDLAQLICKMAGVDVQIERGNKPPRNRSIDTGLSDRNPVLRLPTLEYRLNSAVTEAAALLSNS